MKASMPEGPELKKPGVGVYYLEPFLSWLHCIVLNGFTSMDSIPDDLHI